MSLYVSHDSSEHTGLWDDICKVCISCALYIQATEDRMSLRASAPDWYTEHTPLHVGSVSGGLAPPPGRKAPLHSGPGRSTELWLHLTQD